ncbi:MAG: TIGR03960 family B12-binding radical SAM protein, partial [Anaerolineae bacterium]|nr:TIGR03960 family B12-binding radical SAM protein [Anaerolineae bacterium]
MFAGSDGRGYNPNWGLSVEISEERLDQILSQVTKPARYTGREWNSVVKDWNRVRTKVLLAYPDLYEVGMSNLGFMILYDLLNKEEDLLAERAYTPWVDMEESLRRAKIPLYSLETRHALGDFDIIGFSLSYELNYTNILTMLDLAGIPLLSCQRDESHPLIIAGGSCANNPEPLADFFDLFVIGEGEEVLLELIEAYREWGKGERDRFLHRAAQIEGIYVPSLYEVAYGDGGLGSPRPRIPEARPVITRRILNRLPPPPTQVIVPYVEAVHDRGMIEIMRGCTRGCRFCQAGVIYRPLRERPVEEVLVAADQLLKATGHEELSLVSLSSCDHSQIEEMVRGLVTRHAPHYVTVSLPSLRVDSFSLELATLFQGRRKTGLTFAPEAGSQRLREVINKGVTEEDILSTAERAFRAGWQRIKLYFMIGLPTESMEDVAAICDLVKRIGEIGRKIGGRRAQVSISVATFVPKPHTPFQWMALEGEARLEEKQAFLRRELKNFPLSWSDPQVTLLEAILSRGDRRLGAVIYEAWRRGARFDAW